MSNCHVPGPSNTVPTHVPERAQCRQSECSRIQIVTHRLIAVWISHNLIHALPSHTCQSSVLIGRHRQIAARNNFEDGRKPPSGCDGAQRSAGKLRYLRNAGEVDQVPPIRR